MILVIYQVKYYYSEPFWGSSILKGEVEWNEVCAMWVYVWVAGEGFKKNSKYGGRGVKLYLECGGSGVDNAGKHSSLSFDIAL